MLEFIVTGVIVGLGSGLLGSILGPRISHALDRERRKEIRIEERHKELRTMITSLIRECYLYRGFAFNLETASCVGVSLSDAYHDYLKAAASYERVPWTPFRIEDERLRPMAARLHALKMIGHEVLTDGVHALQSQPAEWSKRVGGWDKEMRELAQAIDERMDELNW